MVNLTNDEMEFGFSTVKRASHIAITQQCSSPSHSKTLKNVLYIYKKKEALIIIITCSKNVKKLPKPSNIWKKYKKCHSKNYLLLE